MDEEYKSVWTLIMFDLPVLTKKQRRSATHYRQCLLDEGFSMVQLSVYIRYTPSVSCILPALRRLERVIPVEGSVRIIYLTDSQWSRSVKIWNSQVRKNENAPEQLQIF